VAIAIAAFVGGVLWGTPVCPGSGSCDVPLSSTVWWWYGTAALALGAALVRVVLRMTHRR
jgi:hypothetical protein